MYKSRPKRFQLVYLWKHFKYNILGQIEQMKHSDKSFSYSAFGILIFVSLLKKKKATT